MKTIYTAILGVLSCVAAPVFAQSTTFHGPAQINASASIDNTCAIISKSDFGFGGYNSVLNHRTQFLDARATITVRCTAKSPPVKMAVGAGNGLNASCEDGEVSRSMRLGTTNNYLSYAIYPDLASMMAQEQVGCGASNQMQLDEFRSSTVNNLITLYGRVPPGQYTAVGAYTDVVRVDFTF